MKKKTFWTKSIFWKIALIFFPATLLIDGIVLFFGYRQIYNSTYHSSETKIKDTASMVMDTLVYVDLDNEEIQKGLSELFDRYCEYMGVTYIYVLEVDPDCKWIKYLAIGFGEGAEQKAKEERYSGVVVTIEEDSEVVDPQMREAIEKPVNGSVRHDKNSFGDMLIYYLRLMIHIEGGETIQLDDKRIVVGVETSLSNIMESFQRRFNMIAMATIVATTFVLFVATFILYRRISIPAQRISRRMGAFLADGKKEFKPLPVRGNDEFAEMSRAFNTMAEHIDEYVENIESLNREKHTREAELNIAGDIQLGLLRPPHAEENGCVIEARMLPAKDVGGDLYDYQLLPDGRVFIAVADVSGKGITASLFMSRAVTLLHIYSKMGYSPAHILEEYNNTLAAQNPGNMFITTFVAVYDPRTGILTYSNGGHNTPYVLSDTLIPLDGADGIAAGIFAGEKFEEAEIRLKKNDLVFIYTDGVNEAQNEKDEMYTTEALEKELSAHLGDDKKDVVRIIRDTIREFIGSAEQSDDITMLSLFTEREPLMKDASVERNEVSSESSPVLPYDAQEDGYHRELHLPADVHQLPVLNETIAEIPGMTEDLQMALEVMCEEIFVNICSYAYPDGEGEAVIQIDALDQITLTFTDEGIPFDPGEDLPDIDEFDHLNTRGGLGRFIAFDMADSFTYENKDGKNILKLVKSRI